MGGGLYMTEIFLDWEACRFVIRSMGMMNGRHQFFAIFSRFMRNQVSEFDPTVVLGLLKRLNGSDFTNNAYKSPCGLLNDSMVWTVANI